MKYKSFMKWIVAAAVCGLSLIGGRAQAQTAPNTGAGGVMQLPEGVTKIVSLDAYNLLMVESVDANGKRHYNIIQPQHVYSGGLARIFGGTIIPTADLVTPGGANGIGQSRGNSGFGPIGRNRQTGNAGPFSGTVPATGTGTVIGGGFTPIQ